MLNKKDLVTLISVAISAFGGGYFSFLLNQYAVENRVKTENARELVSQFFSPEMVIARRDAYLGVKQINKAKDIRSKVEKINLRNLLEDLKELDKKKSASLERLLGYFHLLGTEVINEHADADIIVVSLERNFNEWFNCYLSSFIQQDRNEGYEWQSTKESILKLKSLIKKPLSKKDFQEHGIKSCK